MVGMPDSPSSPRPRPPAPADDWALFLDVDGCLLEFADTPGGVAVPPGLVDTLAGLARRLDGALALVSGRTLEMLDSLFAPLRLPAAGVHGLERRDAHGHVQGPDAPPALERVAARARDVAQTHPGAVVEPKGAALALHWRAAPGAAQAFERLARDALPRLPGYRLQPGDQVLELRPEGADKGAAIAAFLEAPPFRGRLPVFAGDDLTDEHGFEVVNARGGLSVLVGARGESAARHHLPDPAAVLDWLGYHGGKA
jgi:trehalose 6-phosphate phosphatase